MANTESELVRIRLLNPTLTNLTGVFGNYSFIDGVSELMLRREAERLSVITAVEFVNSENLWERKARERGQITSDNLNTDPPKPHLGSQIEVLAPEPVKSKDIKTYSREELEAIADDKGIQGLREIADPLNVKGVSIRTLLDGILKAQEGQ
jgi:hypothetical protein